MKRRITYIALALLVLASGCGLPLGHREGYVDIGEKSMSNSLHFSARGKGLLHRAGLGEKNAWRRLKSVNGAEVRNKEGLEQALSSLALGDTVKFVAESNQYNSEKKLFETVSTSGEAVVTESDLCESSNYLLWGYEKVGDQTRRRWLHLGGICFGDWIGNVAHEDRESKVNIDLPPLRGAQAIASFAFIAPKFVLLGTDDTDKYSVISWMMPSIFQGGLDDTSHGLNFLFFSKFQSGSQSHIGMWPAAGYVSTGKSHKAYLTPFNIVGWGEDAKQRGFTLAGVLRNWPGYKTALPLYSYVSTGGT